MEFFQILLCALLVGLGTTSDDGCPAPSEIRPCTCDLEGLNCMGPRTLEEIRRAFRAGFKYGGVRNVYVQGTPLTDLPGDLFGKVNARNFHVEWNRQLRSLNFSAFSASKNSMRQLILYGNALDKIDFSGLNQYHRLEVLNLGRNQIQSIPEYAFNLNRLRKLVLSQNQISHIGHMAFNFLSNIETLELSSNRLTSLGDLSFAIRQQNRAYLKIDLRDNQISSVSSSAFGTTSPKELNLQGNRLTSLPKDPFSKLITGIAEKGGFIDVSANPFTCSGCDYSWLVLNKDLLYTKFRGFTCRDGRKMQDLTKSNIRCE